MKLEKLIGYIEDFAPLSYAEEDDNPGLIAGDINKDVTNAVLCLDVTEKAFSMCKEKNAQVCISHHPFIYNAIKSMDFTDPYFGLLKKFIQADIAIYAAHTNLDVCAGGVNDVLSKKLGLIVTDTFLPLENHKEGKSIIDNIAPFIDRVVPGIGRICKVKEEMDLFGFYKTIIRNLQTPGCQINFDINRTIDKILIIGGSYNSDWNRKVIEKGIDVVLCGEIKHRDMIFFERYGTAAFAAGHDATERVVLPDFADYLNLKIKEIRFDVCKSFDYNKVVF
ncbi:MAG: Nif3-like dinuclear metal center hexameric protein [Saccharofermentanales bacterium]